MKKLKDLTDVEKINVPELMKLKGGVLELEQVDRGCDSHACNHNACTGSSCVGNTCKNEACVSSMD
ncbi:hypothetical protein CYCD_20760 [Tenuifilaceae bacterium CYCD]|nr:hypothetical protein CYCD_20760 [Tenuifilaceae bacterium CYCD]